MLTLDGPLVPIAPRPLDQGKVHLGPDGDVVTLKARPPSVGGHDIAVWDPSTEKTTFTPVDLKGTCRALLGRDLVVGSYKALKGLSNGHLAGLDDERIYIWNGDLQEVVSAPFEAHWIAQLPNGEILLSHPEGELSIWGGSDDPVQELPTPGGRLRSVKVLPHWIVAHFADELIRLYPTNDPFGFQDLQWPGVLRAAEEMPGKRIALGGNWLGIVNPRTQEWEVEQESDPIFSLCSLSSHLLCGLKSGVIRVVNDEGMIIQQRWVGSQAVRTLESIGSHLIYSTDRRMGAIRLRDL